LRTFGLHLYIYIIGEEADYDRWMGDKGKEAIMAYLKVLSQYLPIGTEENHKKAFRLDSQTAGRESTLESLKYQIQC
jgi:hypothetical protein